MSFHSYYLFFLQFVDKASSNTGIETSESQEAPVGAIAQHQIPRLNNHPRPIPIQWIRVGLLVRMAMFYCVFVYNRSSLDIKKQILTGKCTIINFTYIWLWYSL